MPNVVYRNALDALVNSAAPTASYSTSPILLVGGATATRYSFVWFTNPVPRGATVSRATLRVYTRVWNTASTLLVRRVRTGWAISRVNWNNQPEVEGVGAQAAVAAGSGSRLVEVDVTALVQEVANGGGYGGFRLATQTNAELSLWASEATPETVRPTLEVEWSEAPAPPTTLSPSGNRAVSKTKPLLTFDFSDRLGDTTLGAVNVQVDPTGTFAAPWDSGWVTAALPQLDLATTAYPGLAAGASTYWRVRVRDGAGLESGWSDAEQFRYVAMPAVAINSPGVDGYVEDPTPPILWSFAGTQTAWQVLLLDADDPTRVLADSRKQTTAETAWTPSTALPLRGKLYRVEVRVWDDQAREEPGAAVYARATRDFDVRAATAVTPVAGLTAVQDGAHPRMLLRWTRATAPDRYVVRRDGLVVNNAVAPEDVFDSGTTYEYADDTARAWHPHDWQVTAVVNNAESASSVVTATPKQRGIWLLDKERDLSVWLAGQDQGTITLAEEASVLVPLGADHVVRRVQGRRGYEGSVTGRLLEAHDRSAAEWEADLLAMRDYPSRPVVLSLGDLTVPVILGNISTYPTTGVPPLRVATFDFWESR